MSNEVMMKHKMELVLNCRWIMMALVIVHCSLFIQTNAGAQTFTQRLQETAKGEASVTVHHDQAIDKLVNGQATANANTAKTAEKTNEAKPATTGTATPKKQQDKPHDADKPATASHPRHDNTAVATPDTTSTEHKPSYKTTGFRIQVYAGGNSRKDRQKAEQIGNQIRMLFPTEAVYVHFYSPRWICRMGNYRTQEEAYQALQEVKKLGYTAATIVKGKITVQY